MISEYNFFSCEHKIYSVEFTLLPGERNTYFLL